MSEAKVYELTQVDIEFFDGIRIESLYICIGPQKLRITSAGVYNQIVAHLRGKKRKDILFAYYLADKYEVARNKPLPVAIIEQWETALTLNTRAMIYVEALRVFYKPDGEIEIYGVTKKCVLTFITTVRHKDFFKNITYYLQYTPSVDNICSEKEIDHALDKTDSEIRSDIKMCMKNKLIPKIDKIKPLSNNINHYCLAYYDLGLGNKRMPTPAWDSFMAQIPDNGARQCFMGWVYSVFKDDNFGRQVLWLYGLGNSGKSRVTRAISDRMAKLNPSVCGSMPSAFNMDKHSSMTFFNKRLVIGPDTKDRALVRQQLVKNVTGNDPIAGRGMFQEEKQIDVYAKIMVTSNEKPFINTEKSEELSRILFIGIQPDACYKAREAWKEPIHGDWVKCLEIEIDNFIAKCADAYYQVLQPDGHNIIPYESMEADIEQGAFSIKRDQYLWWDKCIRLYVPKKGKPPTNILTITQLSDDFTRFISPRNKKGNQNTLIRKFMCTMMRDKKINILLLEADNTLYIKGYEFVPNKTKITMKDYIQTEIERLSATDEDGTPHYGGRI